MSFINQFVTTETLTHVTFIFIRLAGFALLLLVLWGLFKSFLNKLSEKIAKRFQEEGGNPTESSKRAETLLMLLKRAMQLVVWAVLLLAVVREVGLDIRPLLASAGIAGLAIGFGAQNLVRDVISGFFIILENQIRVGDVAVINGTGGLVEEINFRFTRLRDLTGTAHIFPNGSINTVSNLTHEWSAFVFEIGVAYKEDPDRVIEVMKQVGADMRQDEYFGQNIIDDIEVMGVDSFGDSSVNIKGRIKTKPIKQWETGREFRKRIHKRFGEEGIEIPFPHRSIYFGEVSKPFLHKMMNADDKGKDDGPMMA